jgi:phosphoesterase RecJ-like protein
MTDESLQQAAKVLSEAKDVAIACHMNPDPDAIGSMLGLSNFLRSRGVTTTCSFGNDPFEPPRWVTLLPGHETLVPPAQFPKAPEVMVTCDCASSDRLGNLVGRVQKAGEVIWIDHHVSNDGLGTIPLIDPAASSTCEMVFRLIQAMGGPLSPESADSEARAGGSLHMPLNLVQSTAEIAA